MKIKNVNMIEVQDWDQLVEKTYNRIYAFQQQNCCKDRGTYDITIPTDWNDDFETDSIPEMVNGPEMGVSFKAWLKRDPKQKLEGDEYGATPHGISLFWSRNFYPDIQTVANDLYSRGLIPAGEYVINIDW